MSEHTGLPVSGYKPQTAEAVAAVNMFKMTEEMLLRQLEGLPVPVDDRWLAIAKSHFEQGFMAANRAIFQPGRLSFPGDPE